MDIDEHVKEVYAHFGLAMYMAQVLEHGIVNAFISLDLLPKTKGKWTEDEYEAYMDGEFCKTLGRLIAKLSNLTNLDHELDRLLNEALKQRNWLAHHYFRERSAEFLSATGRNSMIAELQRNRDLFKEADVKLENILAPLRHRTGLTDELLEEHLLKFKREANADL